MNKFIQLPQLLQKCQTNFNTFFEYLKDNNINLSADCSNKFLILHLFWNVFEINTNPNGSFNVKIHRNEIPIDIFPLIDDQIFWWIKEIHSQIGWEIIHINKDVKSLWDNYIGSTGELRVSIMAI